MKSLYTSTTQVPSKTKHLYTHTPTGTRRRTRTRGSTPRPKPTPTPTPAKTCTQFRTHPHPHTHTITLIGETSNCLQLKSCASSPPDSNLQAPTPRDVRLPLANPDVCLHGFLNKTLMQNGPCNMFAPRDCASRDAFSARSCLPP